MESSVLGGLRILVLEDEMLISLLIEDMLADWHCTVVGPFDRIAAALAAARTEPIDVALLDVNIAGAKSYQVAEILAARDIPFLFLSGYGKQAIPSDHPDWRVCSKPFRSEDLAAMLIGQIQTNGARRSDLVSKVSRSEEALRRRVHSRGTER